MRDRLQAALDGFIARGIVGATLTVARDDGVLTLVAGLADRGLGAAMTADRLFEVASCTKTFVAATLMALVADGRVALDAPVARWFPDLVHADRIRVRQLIDHTAGLPEFEYAMPVDPNQVWSPAEIVALAFAAGPPDEPGRICAYNNTGYVLAGMLIEALTGETLAAQIRRRVLAPLGLRDTFAGAGEPFPRERLARGYYHRPPPPEGAAGASLAEGGEMWRTGGVLGHSEELQDSTLLFPLTGAYAAGDIVATGADLAAFLAALVTGRLLPPELTANMVERRRPMIMSAPGTRIRESGAGVLALDYDGRRVLGHQGSLPGYVTLMIHEPASGTTLALTTNTGSGNRLSFYASGLHELMDTLLAIAAPAG